MMPKFTRTIADYADQWVNVDLIEMVRTDTNDAGRWCVKAEVGLNRRIVTLCPYQDGQHDFDTRGKATVAALYVMERMGGIVGIASHRIPVEVRDDEPDELDAGEHKPASQVFGGKE